MNSRKEVLSRKIGKIEAKDGMRGDNIPTNLPPKALKAKEEYEDAKSIETKISKLKNYISQIPRHI
ncbi:MAG: hypothetical protein ACFFBS_07105 [Promethearchaeota archaeon]